MAVGEIELLMESPYSPDNIQEKLLSKGIEIPTEPEHMCENEREKESWILFAEVYDQAEEAFGEEWIERRETINQELNRSIVVANETMRKIGYHDKTHAIRFAATYLAQAVAVRQMINVGDQKGIASLLEQRIGGDRLSRDEGGSLMWQVDNGEPVDAVNQLRDEFGVGHVVEVMCAGFEHDSAEKDSSKESHESLAAARMVRDRQALRAQMVLSTRYQTGIRTVENTDDHLEDVIEIYPSGNEKPTREEQLEEIQPLSTFHLQTDSIATHLSARMFSACDYIEMFARDSYVDQTWLSIAGMQGLLHKDVRAVAEVRNSAVRAELSALRFELSQAEQSDSLGKQVAARNSLREVAKNALQEYPLALLWAENFMRSRADAISFANSFDLGIGIADMKFPKYMLYQHRSSVDLLQKSALPSSIHDSLGSKLDDFDVSLQDRWVKSGTGGISSVAMQRMVTLFLDMSEDNGFTVGDKRDLALAAAAGEQWLMAMVAMDPEDTRFNFTWVVKTRSGNAVTQVPAHFGG